MGRKIPARRGRETTEEGANRGRRGPAVKDQSLIDEMREAMKGARERAEERREHSHESALIAAEPAPASAPEPEPAPRGVLRRLFGR
jgi:hypothetical protein